MTDSDYSGFRASLLQPGIPVEQILNVCVEAALSSWRADVHSAPSEDPPYFGFVFSVTLPHNGRVQVVETVKVLLGAHGDGTACAITVTDGALQAIALQDAIHDVFGVGPMFDGAAAARIFEAVESAVFPSSLQWPEGQIVRKG